MNIQTERLEDHTARFTVEVDVTRLDGAKQVAARRLAKRVNIPGFRKGKAPYRILANYIGEGAILEDAIEVLGSEVYKESLDQSDLQPYGPGSLEDFKIEPAPTFTFVVPLQPTVNLNDYRAIRLEYTPPTVEDREVDGTLRLLQEQHAVIEESHKPVAPGDRITADIHSHFIDKEAESSETETEGAETKSDDDTLIHRHDMQILLTDDPDRELSPGFNKAVEGATVGETREFELSYPDDKDEYEDLAGRRAHFEVAVKKIETVTLPALNDDFVARVTSDEEKPLTLLELRIRVRENLQKSAETRANSEYALKVLDKMIEQATIGFPEALVHDQIETILKRMDNDLRQRGLTLDDYMTISNKKRDDLNQEYRETAVKIIQRSLMLREVRLTENVEVSDERVNEQINIVLTRFGDQSENVRPLFNEPAMRDNVKNELLEEHVMERIAAIGKGEAPEIVPAPPVSHEGESV